MQYACFRHCVRIKVIFDFSRLRFKATLFFPICQRTICFSKSKYRQKGCHFNGVRQVIHLPTHHQQKRPSPPLPLQSPAPSPHHFHPTPRSNFFRKEQMVSGQFTYNFEFFSWFQIQDGWHKNTFMFDSPCFSIKAF